MANAPDSEEQLKRLLEGAIAGKECKDSLNFTEETFTNPKKGIGITFRKSVSFRKNTFKEYVDFTEAVFEKEVNFEGAVFEKGVNFKGAVFKEAVKFNNCVFLNDAYFWKTQFIGKAEFKEIRVEHAADENHRREPGEANFSWASFHTEANFHRSHFNGSTYFWRTTFGNNALFTEVKFADSVTFEGTQCEVCFSRYDFKGEGLSESFFKKLIEKHVLVLSHESEISQIHDDYVHIHPDYVDEKDFKARLYLVEEDIQDHEDSPITKLIGLRNRHARKMFSTSDPKSRVDFTGTEFRKSEEVKFYNVNLATCIWGACNLEKINFYNIEWAKQNKQLFLIKQTRNAIYDEILFDINRLTKENKERSELQRSATRVKLLYNQLRKNYETYGGFIESSDFSYGEMEMRLKTRDNQFINWWYKQLCGYGEEPIRAILWLLLTTFLIFPLIYTFLPIIDSAVQPKSAKESIMPAKTPGTLVVKPGQESAVYVRTTKGAGTSVGLPDSLKKRSMGDSILLKIIISDPPAAPADSVRTFGSKLLAGEIRSMEMAAFLDKSDEKHVPLWWERFFEALQRLWTPFVAALFALAVKRKFDRK